MATKAIHFHHSTPIPTHGHVKGANSYGHMGGSANVSATEDAREKPETGKPDKEDRREGGAF